MDSSRKAKPIFVVAVYHETWEEDDEGEEVDIVRDDTWTYRNFDEAMNLYRQKVGECMDGDGAEIVECSYHDHDHCVYHTHRGMGGFSVSLTRVQPPRFQVTLNGAHVG